MFSLTIAIVWVLGTWARLQRNKKKTTNNNIDLFNGQLLHINYEELRFVQRFFFLVEFDWNCWNSHEFFAVIAFVDDVSSTYRLLHVRTASARLNG